MADKPEFVDLVGAATRQRWRIGSVVKRAGAATGLTPDPKAERSRLSTWPPPRLAMWRLDLIKPWKKRNNPHE